MCVSCPFEGQRWRRADRGGDGIVREIEALAPMRFTLISERRRHAPRGRDGGADGLPGRNLLNGEPLPSKAAGELRAGDRLRVETPGGGGHGRRGCRVAAAPGPRQPLKASSRARSASGESDSGGRWPRARIVSRIWAR